jgi:hypothetical protein
MYNASVEQNLVKDKTNISKIATLLSLMMVSLICWALSSPIGSSPDDNFHLPSIWCAETFFNSDCNQLPNGIEVPRDLLVSDCIAFKPEIDGSCTERIDNSAILYDHLNNIGGDYPTGFYSALSMFKDENKTNFVFKVRLVNSLLYILSLFLLLLIVKDLNIWIKNLFIQILVLIPLGFFVIPSTNPSSWSLIFLPGLWLALYAVGKRLNNSPTRNDILIIVLFWICVNFARSDGSLYSIIAVLSILILFFPKRSNISPRYFILNISLILFSFFTYVLNQPAKSISSVVNYQENKLSLDVLDTQLLIHNVQNIFYYFTGAAGKTGLGWLDTYPPSFVWKSLVVAMSVLVVASLILMLIQKNYVGLAGSFFIIACYLSIPLVFLQVNNYEVGEWVQPRYMLPLFLVLILVTSLEVTVTKKSIFMSMLLLSPVLFLDFSLSLGANIQRYSGIAQDPLNVSSYLNSNWGMFGIPSLNIFVIGIASFGLFLFALNDLYFNVFKTEILFIRMKKYDEELDSSKRTKQERP